MARASSWQRTGKGARGSWVESRSRSGRGFAEYVRANRLVPVATISGSRPWRTAGAEVRVHANGEPTKRVHVFAPRHLPHVRKDLYRIVQREADSATEAQIVASLQLVVIPPVGRRDLDSRAVDHSRGHRR